MSSYKIVIPTRNNALWLEQFLTAYRQIGVEPLYVVDARSTDDTIALLESMHADFIVYPGDGSNVVEGGVLPFVAARMPADCAWTLRLDDDEFPSRRLIEWLEADDKAASTMWAVSRRDVLQFGTQYLYNRYWSMFHHADQPDYLYGHVRLYKHQNVEFFTKIHSPGLIEDATEKVPQDAYFIHLDYLLRSISQRVSKLRAYERDHPGTCWRYGDHYLPEICAPKDLDAAPIGTTEFDRLLASIPKARKDENIELTLSEIQTLRSGAYDKLEFQKKAETLREAQTGRANRPIGELLCTVSRFMSHFGVLTKSADTLYHYGARLQYNATRREARSVKNLHG